MDERLEKVRQMLLAQKREILQKIQQGRKDPLEMQGGDFIDIATDSLEYELDYIFSERERQKLQTITEALDSIKEGTYGECDDCGEEIELERLLALPFVRLCLDCKAKQERQKKLKVYLEPEELAL